LNREARAEERGQRATREKLEELAKARAPERLAVHALDATTHRLVWPSALEDVAYAAEREAVDRLMIARTSEGPEGRDVQALTGLMLERLRTQVHVLKPNDYVTAKRFLISLDYEMNFAPGAAAVAVR
jgi:hypothetical protein